MNIRTFALAAFLAAGFAASAQAFTFEDKGSASSSSGAAARNNLSDPVYDRGTIQGENKRTLYDGGNFKMEMYGSQQPSSAQQFNLQRERMLNPGMRD